MAKTIGSKAAKIALAAAGAAALSAVGTGAVLFRKWAKDPYSKEIWFGFLKKGILISKTDEPRHYRVQTGYRWHNDVEADVPGFTEEPVMEIPLPEEPADAPEEPEAGPEEAAAPEEGTAAEEQEIGEEA